MDSSDLLDLIRKVAREESTRHSPEFAIGVVDAGYAGGRPTVRFEGESTTSSKPRPYLASYTPAANDRVLLVRARGSWVVLGEIT